MQDSEHHDGARDTRWRDDRMTGRRSHGRLSALNGVVHQGSSITPTSYSNPSVAISGNPTTRPRRMTSLRTAVAFREECRPSTLPAHNREHTSMAANNHVALLLLPMNVQSSSACNSMISKSRNIRWLKRFAAVEARSSHRAMVWRAWPVTRAVAEMLTPSTRRLATWSHALRAQRRPRYAVPVCVLTVPPQTVQRYPPASAPLRRKRTVAHDIEAQFSTVVTPALGAGHPVDRVHRSSVPGGNPRFSPKISEVKATDQQRPAQAPSHD